MSVRAPAAVAMSKPPIVAPQRTPSRKWYWYCHGVWQAPSDEWGQWNSYVRPTCMSLQYFQSYSLTEPSVLRTEGSLASQSSLPLTHMWPMRMPPSADARRRCEPAYVSLFGWSNSAVSSYWPSLRCSAPMCQCTLTVHMPLSL